MIIKKSAVLRSPAPFTISSRMRCCRAPALPLSTFWDRLRANSLANIRRISRAQLQIRDDLAGADRRLSPSAIAGGRSIPPITRDSCARSAISCPSPPDFSIATENVDDEIALVPGPQLVVPVSNARYVLNAANARWGSLYEALYGTDAISSADGGERGKGYNKIRGARVVAWGAGLSRCVRAARRREPQGCHSLSRHGRQARRQARRWLPRPDCKTRRNFAAIAARPARRARCSCAITACISRSSSIAQSRIGADDPAGVSDIVIEAALTAIMDLEDSVAAVDAADKVGSIATCSA